MDYKNAALAAVVALTIASCTPQGREAFHSADETTSQAAQKMANAAKTDANATGKILKGDLSSSDKKMPALKAGAENTVVTVKVKMALGSSKDVNTSNLTVDTVGKKVELKGAVPSAAQKHQAAVIAQKSAGAAYTVSNQLVVSTK